jgi:hypothetical protein
VAAATAFLSICGNHPCAAPSRKNSSGTGTFSVSGTGGKRRRPVCPQFTATVHHVRKNANPVVVSSPYGARRESGGGCRRTLRRFVHRRPRFVFKGPGNSPRTFLGMFDEKIKICEIFSRRKLRVFSVFSLSRSLPLYCTTANSCLLRKKFRMPAPKRKHSPRRHRDHGERCVAETRRNYGCPAC